jgi:O-antigen ligase
MTRFAWFMLILAALLGAFLFVAVVAIVLTLLLANVAERLEQTDETRSDS